MRRLGLMLVVLLLSACGREANEPALDTRVPPQASPRHWPPTGWTWSMIEVEQSRIRYGVAAPSVVHRGHVIILPSLREPAEIYFETARELADAGFVVWTLDGADQPAVRSKALAGLIADVVRPGPDEAVVIAAGGDAFAPALLAASGGTRRIEGLFLWSPELEEPMTARAAEKVRRGLGWTQVDGSGRWTRPGPEVDLTTRAALPDAWSLANPDLRPAPATWESVAERGRVLASALAAGRPPRAEPSVFILGAPGDGAPAILCAKLQRCRTHALSNAGALPMHLDRDGVRDAWAAALLAFCRRVDRERDHAM
jgi:alpha-beta hydrolase superfamily lysophospholipase